jgi:hypothetical protein
MDTKQTIAELYLCAAQCDACYKACLSQDDDKMQRCMNLTLECFETCGFLGKLLEKGSEYADKYLKLCAQICDACAEECRKHHHDHCQKCAEQCHKCSEMCLHAIPT